MILMVSTKVVILFEVKRLISDLIEKLFSLFFVFGNC